MTCADILELLASRPNPHSVEGMARFGIVAKNVCGGWPVPALRKLARQLGRNHALAQQLWASGIFEARLLATLVDDPAQVTERQMDRWAKSLENWADCDGACCNLFRYSPLAPQKCREWSARPEEFVRRAGFSLMAGLTVAEKEAGDEVFLEFLPLIVGAAQDPRNFVKKAVNWALRQIGKRDARLNRAALATCDQISRLDSSAARWIASDARRELTSDAVQASLKHRAAARRVQRPKPQPRRKRAR